VGGNENNKVREFTEDLNVAYQNAGKLSEANEVLQPLIQSNRQVENVSEKDIEIFLKQDIPPHKDAVDGNENNKQVREFTEDLNVAYQNAGKLSEANEVLQPLIQSNRQVENVSEKDIEIFLKRVIPLHKDAVDGNEKAVQDMQKLLEKARSDYPGHPLVDAYYGITLMLIARDKKTPMSRLRGAKAGLKLLDEAVNAAPQDGRIRLLRGRASYGLPENYFQRSQTTIEDYTFLIDQKIHEEGFLQTGKYLQLIYELGEVYCRIGRNQAAAMCWKRLKNETQDPDFHHLLNLKLKSLEGKPAVEHIPNTESPTSILIKRTMSAAGSALLSWAEQQIKEETLQLNQKGRRLSRLQQTIGRELSFERR
jgi:tetratricopeptide (TPR) repeat protein